MNSRVKRFTLTTALVALGAGSAIGLSAFGATMMAGQPTVVVTVNLSQVMEKLNQRADATARLNKIRDEMTAEQNRRMEQIKKLEADAKAVQADLDKATDPAQKKSLEARMQAFNEQAAMMGLDNQAWVAFSADKVDIEAALIMQDLYRSVKAAAAQMATTNRYDVVLVDDSHGELATTPDSRVTRVDQVRQQVAARRMLYVNPVIDITDDLIARMNNAHKAAGPKTAP